MEIDKNQKSTSSCLECPARSSSCFKRATGPAISEIETQRKLINLKAGETFVFERDGECGACCVLEGHLTQNHEWQGRRGVVGISGPGQLMGFRSSSSEVRQSATALEDSVICFFSDQTLERLRAQFPEISEGTIDALCKTLKVAENRVAGLENHSLQNRVASALLSLNKKFGTSEHGESRIGLNIDRKTLALLAGTVPESLARVLSLFESDEIIRRKGRAIVIADLKRLREMATR